MTLPDYDWAMEEMLKDRDYMYGSMVKDIYFLGVVLRKKIQIFCASPITSFMYGSYRFHVSFWSYDGV
jgi:hypothetical protein